MEALLLTYHAVDDGDGPLHIDPATFAAHLDCIVESGAAVTTVTELARDLRADIGGRRVAITFDDGLASVSRVAAPLLASRGLRATIYCVAGHVGGESNWPSARPGLRRLELARADELAELAEQGWELGSHGMTHAPLVTDDASVLEREVTGSKARLEEVAGAPVTSFAFPYGAGPSAAAASLVAASYEAACTTAVGVVDARCDLHALPRVDAHYLRRPRLLRSALAGSLGPYLRARKLGATARRALHTDYAEFAS